jgi:hypothetical protein
MGVRMIIQIPVVDHDPAAGKKFAIEFDCDRISKTLLGHGVDHDYDGGMTPNDSSVLTFYFDNPEDSPKWIEIP